MFSSPSGSFQRKAHSVERVFLAFPSDQPSAVLRSSQRVLALLSVQRFLAKRVFFSQRLFDLSSGSLHYPAISPQRVLDLPAVVSSMPHIFPSSSHGKN